MKTRAKRVRAHKHPVKAHSIDQNARETSRNGIGIIPSGVAPFWHLLFLFFFVFRLYLAGAFRSMRALFAHRTKSRDFQFRKTSKRRFRSSRASPEHFHGRKTSQRRRDVTKALRCEQICSNCAPTVSQSGFTSEGASVKDMCEMRCSSAVCAFSFPLPW